MAILPHQSQSEYLSLLAAADVLLDPPHFGGVNSTFDGLALGKPIVTWPSDFHRGRFTLGCYRRMGLDDAVAASAEEYVQKAVAMGSEPDLRREVAARIRASRHVLFEDPLAVSEHERILRHLADLACRQPNGLAARGDNS
jgi:predicted O-linked N-acetylglucosamine transferase (SPINDLY family)